METETKVVERDGSKVVEVRLGTTLSREDEVWFLRYLTKAEGVAYMEHRKDTMRLAGYGVWEYAWDNFRFWLGVSIYSSYEKEEG
jgi:hypothetical protein